MDCTRIDRARNPDRHHAANYRHVQAFRSSPADPLLVKLTSRERDVLWLLSHGHCNKVIGRHLAITEPTVKVHITSILRALACSNRTQAALVGMAIREGLDLSRLGYGGPQRSSSRY